MSHPILEAAADIDQALKQVADVNPTFMSTEEKAAALRELGALEGRLVELRLRVLADAGDVAALTAAHDVDEWVAVETRGRFEEARADLVLARALDRRHAVLAAALRDGAVNLAQARVIARALDDLPDEVPVDVAALAEETLVDHATRFGPRQLARLGRKILEVVAPEIADAAEARRLTALEAEAHRRTRLSLRRVGDGTTRLSGLIPDAAATRLATYLQAFTNPRQPDPGLEETSATVELPPPAAGVDPVARLAYPRRLGEAFCQLLEAIDPARLPVHGGDATTVIVTLSLADLQAELATATCSADSSPGPRASVTRSPPTRPAGWPAPPASSPPSSAASRRSSTSAAAAGSTPQPSAARCGCATAPAAPRAATSPPPGAKPTTSTPGHAADTPPSTTAPCSAPTITTPSTTPATAPNASPTATSATTDADRPAAEGPRPTPRTVGAT